MDRSHYLIQKAKAKKEGFLSGSGKEMPEDYIIFPILSLLLCSWQQFRLLRDRSGRLTSLKGIFMVLKPLGRFVINVTDGEYPREHIQSRPWDWIDKTLFVCRERSLALDMQR